MAYDITKEDPDNPRLQCERCGQWSRLYKNDKQNHFPYYIEDKEGQVWEMYGDVCVKCQDILDGFKKELRLAFDTGKDNYA